MKFIVTGGRGFIGSHFVELCLNNGHSVIDIDFMGYCSNKFLPFDGNKNYEHLQQDICEINHLPSCDVIVNFAAETHVDNSIEDSDAFVHSNINGVHHLLKLLNKKKYKRPVFLHFSTDEVYGDIEVGSHTEEDLLKPSNPYSATKAAADHLVTSWGRTYNMPYIIVRPTNNYGIGQYVEKLIPKSVKYLSVGRKVDLHNQGTPVRTWLNANDTAKAILCIIDSGVTNEIFNISGNYETQNIEVVKKIVNFMQLQGPVEDYIEHMVRAGQDVRYSVDDSKLRNLGWKPYADFDIELALIVKYYKENFVW